MNENTKKDKVIFLDRDGTINVNPYRGSYITKKDDFIFIDKAKDALKNFLKLNYKLIIITNQRCVHLKLITEKELNDIHSYMLSELNKEGIKIDKVYYCPHDLDSCECRKPKIGMFKKAEEELKLNIDKKNSFMVGDSPNDILAGKNFGVKTVFLKNDLYSLSEIDIKSDYVFDSLFDFSKFLLL